MKVLSKPESTIARTLKTAILIDGFWDRWIVHGVKREDIARIRSTGLQAAELWVQGWKSLAGEKKQQARDLMEKNRMTEAELGFRLAGLYYNLIHWIYPEKSPDKENWYRECLTAFQIADSISSIKTEYAQFEVDGHKFNGRIRIPETPVGCIIIVNPIDSSKEELFLYENDFAKAGFITISFDGPGQGENYVLTGYRATRERWERFMNGFIDFSSEYCGDMPLFTFGTSLGASWVLYASCNSKIKKGVAVSPAVAFSKLNLPGYFLEKMDQCCILDEGNAPVPEFEKLFYRSPVWVFHGIEDMMVSKQHLNEVYDLLAPGKKLVEYEREGHCCNYKLGEIREIAVQWFRTESMEKSDLS